jgi:hypothetical protein
VEHLTWSYSNFREIRERLEALARAVVLTAGSELGASRRSSLSALRSHWDSQRVPLVGGKLSP